MKSCGVCAPGYGLAIPAGAYCSPDMVTVQKMQEILVQDQGEQVSLAPSNCVIHETKYMVYVSGLPEDGTKV